MSNSRIRSIKWLGGISAVTAAIAAYAAGDVVTAVGIISAALTSPSVLVDGSTGS